MKSKKECECMFHDHDDPRGVCLCECHATPPPPPSRMSKIVHRLSMKFKNGALCGNFIPYRTTNQWNEVTCKRCLAKIHFKKSRRPE